MKLQEVLDVATKDFFERVKRITDDMKNKTQNFIAAVSTSADEFNVALRAYAIAESDIFVQ